MITYKLKIKNAYEAKNSLPAAIFGYTIGTNELVKVSGDFTEQELRKEYIIVNISDYKTPSGYHKLLFTGQLPSKETFKNLERFCEFIEFRNADRIFSVIGSGEAEKFYQKVIRDINNSYEESIKTYCDEIDEDKKEKIREFAKRFKCSMTRTKERYSFEYARYYFMSELDKLGLTDIEFKYNLMKKHKNAESLMKFIDTIKEDVYVLLNEEMTNIKFVDDLALKTGVAPDSQSRISILCEYNLRKLGDGGCTWVELDWFIDRLKDLDSDGFIAIQTSDFIIDKDTFKDVLIDISNENNTFWIDSNKTRIASRKYYDLEFELYSLINDINAADNPKIPSRAIINTAIKTCEKQSGIKYTSEQANAVKNTFNSNLALITGAAGTGKSTVAKAVTETYKAYNIICVALSGKAAIRIGETTNLTGKTMHSTLNSIDGDYIEADVIVIDEASRLGLDIVVKFFRKIKPGTTVLVLGDSSQLSPIGSGNVFYDLLKSKKINVNEITQVHRQALESNIIRFATDVRMQVPIQETLKKDLIYNDFKLLMKNTDTGISRAVTTEFKSLVQRYSIEDVIIVTPYKTRDTVNTLVINNRIQEHLINSGAVDNSSYKWITVDKSRDLKFKICINDRVINTQNHYNALDSNGNKNAIMNGSLGTVVSITKNKVIIDFDFIGKLQFTGSMIDDLLLGYAISVHKSQGSQAKAVIYACPENVGRLGCCEQIYTAVTRAQEICVVIGTKAGINQCILTKELATKKTLLRELLDNDGVPKDNNLKSFAEKYKPKKTRRKEKKPVEETNVVLDGQVTIEEVLPETEAAVDADADVKLKKSKKTTSSKQKLPKVESDKKQKIRERYDKNNIRRKLSRRNENMLNEREQAKVNNIKVVQDMVAKGAKNKDIVEATGLTKGTVSKYIKIDLESYIKAQIKKAKI